MSEKMVLDPIRQYRIVVRFYDSPQLTKPMPVSRMPDLKELGVSGLQFIEGTNQLIKVVLTGSGLAIAKWLKRMKQAIHRFNQGFRAWDWRMSELTEVDLEKLPTA